MSSNFKSLASYSDIFRVLRRRWKRTALLFLGFMGLIVLALIVWPRSYQSEGKLFVRQTVKHITQDPSATKGQSVYMQQSREFEINSIVEMLRSQALAEKVVDQIGPEVILDEAKEEETAADAVGKPTQRERAVLALSRSLEVSAPQESTVIDIHCQAASPELSQQIVDTLMNAYLEEHVRVNRTDGSYGFFAEQTKLLKSKLDAANAELRDAKNEMQVLSVAGKQNSLQQQIHSIEMEQIAAGREVATSQSKIEALTRSINEMPQRLMTEEVSGISSLASDSMRNELYKLEAEEQGLIAKYTEDHPEVVAVRKQIGELRRIFSQQEKQVTQFTTGPNLNRQQLELALLNEKASLATAERRLAKLNEQHATVVARLESLNAAEVRLAELQQDVDIAKANYAAYADKLEQSRMHHELETDRISNVKIAQNATLQRKPASPQPGLVLVLGCFIAAVCSVGLTLVLESQDRSLSSRDEIEQQFSLPVLMSIPRVSQQRAPLN